MVRLGPAFVFFALFVNGQPVLAQVVHAVLCVPTEFRAQSAQANASTNAGSQGGLRHIRSILDYLPEDKLRITELIGDDYAAETLLSTIRGLRVSADDTVFVYVIAHGLFDSDQRFMLHVSNLAYPPSIARERIVKEVRSHDVRLGIIITESCAKFNRMVKEDIDRIFGGTPRTATSDRRKDAPELVKHLFLRERGHVDFLGATAGQVAGYYSSTGPIFTKALEETVQRRLQQRLSWDAVFLEARQVVWRKTNRAQTPLATATPKHVKRNLAIFDMAVKGSDRKVVIAVVDKGGNIERIGLKPNDVILSINENTITTTGQYLVVVDRLRLGDVVRFQIGRGGTRFSVSLDTRK
ncbi:MAG: PDZ domain-containing protein [Planctomycetaceae bacterium]|nr:MAG: PDZ domain-containing protein [Planctomycetaceae bacterium]